ncbi:unnamed protein product, partial [Rotaria magnacalcarata]
IKFVRETYRPALMTTPLLVDILSFINNWISGCNRLKSPKKNSTELNKLLNTQFNITVNTRFNISYIEISMVENQFRFNQDLANYFANNASDHICDKCSMLMSRQIKISDCSIVIILKVNDIKNSTNLSYKPPPAVCFYPLLDDSYIGCAFSSVYDILAFLSVVSDVNNKLVLATKIEQRWKISCMNTLIGNREKLAKLFANIHHQCPSFIMYHSSFNSVMNLHVELTDYKQKKHLYKPSTVLLIDEYNSISVIQLDEVWVFPSCPYAKAPSYTNEEINELFDTIVEHLLYFSNRHRKHDLRIATAVSTSTSIQFNQLISVRPLNKCTNKLTVGSIRSLKIVPQ